MRRGVVIGLDGATWSILRPVLEVGAMPHLASLLDRSAVGTLRSTIPPYTPPAWTTAVTGVNPGRHGIFGFVQGTSTPSLAHWGMVGAPAVWDHLERAGGTVGLFHLPLTYPPPRVRRWAVGAVWMHSSSAMTGFAHPASVERRIRDLEPDYRPVTGVEVMKDWRTSSLVDRVAHTLRARRRVLADLLERTPPELVWAVYEAPDRLHHAYYKYLDPAEPHSKTPEGRLIRAAAESAWRELDSSVELLDGFAGADGVTLACSDHGATGWDGQLFGNVILAQAGLLRLRPMGRALAAIRANRMAGNVRWLLPERFSHRARRRVQSMIDLPRTKALATRLGTQGFSVNLSRREPSAGAPADDAEAIKASVEQTLRAARGPSGDPLFHAVHRREELYEGPYVADAPDLVVEPADWRFEVSDAIGERRIVSDLSSLPLGCHHPDGIIALRAPGISEAADVRASIADVAPTLMYAMGAAVPAGLDGKVRRDLFRDGAPPVIFAPEEELPSPSHDENPYSEEEEALILKYLSDLGYLG